VRRAPDRPRAEAFAREHNQEGILDLKKKETIRTKGEPRKQAKDPRFRLALARLDPKNPDKAEIRRFVDTLLGSDRSH
jgi:hypothetical protein